MNPFKTLGSDSRRALLNAVMDLKGAEVRRLVNITVKETAAAKDPAALLSVISRQAGRVDAMDNLLSLIYDADKP